MKKILVVIVSFCALSVAVNGQSTTTTTSGSKFSIGPSAGYGWTTIGNLENSKFKAAGNFGLAMVYSAAEHFGIGLDVKYSIEGAKFKRTNDEELDLHYVRIPLKANYFFGNYGSNVRPKIFVGPSFGILSSAKANSTPNDDIDISEHLEKLDIGIVAGAGLNYRLANKTWLNFDVALMNGLTDVVKENDPIRPLLKPSNSSDKFTNRNITLNVGVNFGL